MVIGAATLVACYLLFINAYRFLAITHRVNTDMLVIEGWVHEYAVTAGAEEFQTAAYHHFFTTGRPVIGQGDDLLMIITPHRASMPTVEKSGLPAKSV